MQFYIQSFPTLVHCTHTYNTHLHTPSPTKITSQQLPLNSDWLALLCCQRADEPLFLSLSLSLSLSHSPSLYYNASTGHRQPPDDSESVVISFVCVHICGCYRILCVWWMSMTSLKEMDNDVIYYSFKSVLGRFDMFFILHFARMEVYRFAHYHTVHHYSYLWNTWFWWSITAFHSRIFLYNEH